MKKFELTEVEIKTLINVLENGFPLEDKKRNILITIYRKLRERLSIPTNK